MGRGTLVLATSPSSGSLVGCAGVEISDVSKGSSPQSSVAVLSNLAVSSSFRRKGVGRKLCKAVEDWSLERGSDWVYLYVETTNGRAIKVRGGGREAD